MGEASPRCNASPQEWGVIGRTRRGRKTGRLADGNPDTCTPYDAAIQLHGPEGHEAAITRTACKQICAGPLGKLWGLCGEYGKNICAPMLRILEWTASCNVPSPPMAPQSQPSNFGGNLGIVAHPTWSQVLWHMLLGHDLRPTWMPERANRAGRRPDLPLLETQCCALTQRLRGLGARRQRAARLWASKCGVRSSISCRPDEASHAAS